MPDTNYDRFFVEEHVKHYKTQEQLEEFVALVKEIEEDNQEAYVKAFKRVVNKSLNI